MDPDTSTGREDSLLTLTLPEVTEYMKYTELHCSSCECKVLMFWKIAISGPGFVILVIQILGYHVIEVR